MVYQSSIEVQTSGHRDMHDLTTQVTQIVGFSGVHVGIVQIFHVGSTGAIGAIEFEPGLQEDLPRMLDKLLPPSRSYGHEQTWRDGNAHSHLQATILGPSLMIPVAEGRPVLGDWQQIAHIECDVRPRKRKIIVTVLGEEGA